MSLARVAGIGLALCFSACDHAAGSGGHDVPPPVPLSPSGTPAASTNASRSPLSANQLCVTEGALSQAGDRLSIQSAKFRAVVALTTDPSSELRFTYLGATEDTTALGSGRVRRQIGLKLRAQNGCNLVYAMWRIDPVDELSVQVKRNPSQQTFAECKNDGYRNVSPMRRAPLPPVAPGSSHALRAAMHGSDLSVWADDVLVWEGNVGDDVMAFDGPVGLRSDNGRFAFEFFAGSPGAVGVPRSCSDAKGE